MPLLKFLSWRSTYQAGIPAIAGASDFAVTAAVRGVALGAEHVELLAAGEIRGRLAVGLSRRDREPASS